MKKSLMRVRVGIEQLTAGTEVAAYPRAVCNYVMVREAGTKVQQPSEVYNEHLMQLMFMAELGKSGSRSLVRERQLHFCTHSKRGVISSYTCPVTKQSVNITTPITCTDQGMYLAFCSKDNGTCMHSGYRRP